MTIDEDGGGGSPPTRRRGRPRDPGANRRILTGARSVVADVGVRGASMSAIAERCGVGKPTIYLRWANRRELMLAAVADLRSPVVTEHTGSTRDDLVRSLLDDWELLVAGDESRFLRSVLFEVGSDRELAHELESSILGPRRARLVAILARAADEGRIRAGVDTGALADLLAGPLVRAMVVGGPSALEPQALRAQVDALLDGIGAAPERAEARQA